MSEPSRPWRIGLVVWVGLAALLMWLAPAPPAVPLYTADEVAVWDRTAREAGENSRTWQRERGDVRVPWDEAKGHLAIVIDDVGRELHLFEQLLSLRHQLTFSVLPRSVYAVGAQLRLRSDARRYREILLHLPMEPRASEKMEEGAESGEVFLLRSDDAETLRAKVEEALTRVPAAVGVNNHMGSALTEDRESMDAVMEALAGRDLFFLDSRTSGASVAEAAARSAGVKTVPRHVFLDTDTDPGAIRSALEEAVTRALEAPTVAIAHPSPALVSVLQTTLSDLHERGVVVYPLSEIVAHAPTRPASHKE